MVTKEILNERETAEYLSINLTTLRYLRYQNRGPKYSKVGRFIRYLRSDVLAWFGENSIDPEDQEEAAA